MVYSDIIKYCEFDKLSNCSTSTNALGWEGGGKKEKKNTILRVKINSYIKFLPSVEVQSIIFYV